MATEARNSDVSVFAFSNFWFLSSPFLHAKVREVVSDCALPISVVIFSFVGSYLFIGIQREPSLQNNHLKWSYWLFSSFSVVDFALGLISSCNNTECNNFATHKNLSIQINMTFCHHLLAIMLFQTWMIFTKIKYLAGNSI